MKIFILKYFVIIYIYFYLYIINKLISKKFNFIFDKAINKQKA